MPFIRVTGDTSRVNKPRKPGIITRMMNRILQQLAETGGITMTIRVHPGARETQVKDVLADGCIKLDVAAPRKGGKANHELIRFFAHHLGVPQANIVIMKGETRGRKVVRITAAP